MSAPATPPAPPAPVRLLKGLIGDGLSRRIALAASVLALSIVAVIGGSSYYFTRAQMARNILDSLGSDASVHAEYLGGRLESVTTTLSALARNTLVINALFDSAGREGYLDPFLRDFGNVGGVPVGITLTDFQGEPILRTGGSSKPGSLSAWIAPVLHSATPRAEIVDSPHGPRLRVGEPIIYPGTRTVEGVLVYEIPMQSIAFGHPVQDADSRHVRVLYSSSGEDGPPNFGIAAGGEAIVDPDSRLKARAGIPTGSLLDPLGLRVEVIADGSLLRRPLSNLSLIYAGLGLATLLVVLAFSRAAAQRLTRPLRKLKDVASAVVASGSHAHRFTAEGDDEVARLGAAFNRMLERLGAAFHELEQQTESLKVSEARYRSVVEDQTEFIVRCRPDGACTFVNDAYCRQFGHPCDDLLNGNFFSPMPAGVRKRLRRKIRALTPENTHFTDVHELLMENGSSRWHEWTVRGIFSEGEVSELQAIGRDVTEVRRLTEKLSFEASHDGLTGLINRREFERRLENALLSAHNQDQRHVLCYIDVDQFKIINDSCGHHAGDEALKRIAASLRAPLRKTDVLARFSGDEFAILLEGCSLERGREIAERLRHGVQEHRFVWQDKSFDLSVSIGVVAVTKENCDLADALTTADLACYMAKEHGRNDIYVYVHGKDVGEANSRRIDLRRVEMRWVSRITEALDEDRLALYIQPIVAVSGNHAFPDHYEVLVRLLDRDGTLVPPGAFIPAAERFGLMPQVDRWVIRNVLRRYRESAGINRFTVNLSGTSLGKEDFLEFVRAELRDNAIPPGTICFEITETAAIGDLTTAIRFMKEVRKEGCLFALDDFGSGLSSFAYLKHLPVDFLKIDGSFIKEIGGDPVDRAMVEAINRVGKVMGIYTIAEFVESDDVLQVLREIGVDFAQGYALGRPCPWEAGADPAPLPRPEVESALRTPT